MEWPNTEFEIVHTLLVDLEVDTFVHGVALEPLEVLDPYDVNYDALMMWLNRLSPRFDDLIEGDLREFAQSILQKADT